MQLITNDQALQNTKFRAVLGMLSMQLLYACVP